MTRAALTVRRRAKEEETDGRSERRIDVILRITGTGRALVLAFPGPHWQVPENAVSQGKRWCDVTRQHKLIALLRHESRPPDGDTLKQNDKEEKGEERQVLCLGLRRRAIGDSCLFSPVWRPLRRRRDSLTELCPQG